MAHPLSHILDGIASAAYPRLCRICRRPLLHDEHLMCLHCLAELPRTRIADFEFNTIHSRLAHHPPVARAVAWYFYDKASDYARLIVESKYERRPRQCRALGAIMAREMADTGFFDGIDALVPVPLHWKKRLSRGFNQTEEIARGISSVTGIPVVAGLRAVRGHGIQSRHNAAERAAALVGTFRAIHADRLRGRHLLIIDDLITTGATLSEALRALSSASPSALSVLAPGLTVHS